MDIWTLTNGKQHAKPLMANVFRLVESQEQNATLGLVSNIYEQGVLEELIESTKSSNQDMNRSLHYLLKTPFRYPPLKYGSRFGTTLEPGIFYASLTLSTALSETAYYRFVFLLGPETPYESVISSEYTAFSVGIQSNHAILLDQMPFEMYQDELTSPLCYQITQRLGSKMRDSGIEAFRYVSARDKEQGKNIGLFTPNVFCKPKPANLSQWLCQSKINEIGFVSINDNTRVLYKQEDFWFDGAFPSPAV
jgi:hypothetical protein